MFIIFGEQRRNINNDKKKAHKQTQHIYGKTTTSRNYIKYKAFLS